MSGRFLVIGEAGIDRFVVGDVKRLCPEAPAVVLNPIPESESWNAGMAGNVVANLLSLGAEKVDTILSSPPITKTRYVDKQSGYILIRVDENDVVTQKFQLEQLSQFSDQQYHGVLISSYNKGFLTECDISHIVKGAHDRCIPVFADHKFVHGEWSAEIDFVKINRREYEAQIVAGIRPEDFCRNLIVTLGGEGSWWVNQDKKVPVDPVAVSDLSGAGDSFLSAFAIEYIRSKDVLKAMDYANRAARIAVSRRGVVAVQANEVI